MKKRIFIDLRNAEQVDWWNNYARKKVKAVMYNEIVETKTNKVIGVLILIRGLFANEIFKENDKFLGKNIVTVTSKELEKYRK